jgi:hypothetical protein
VELEADTGPLEAPKEDAPKPEPVN